MSDVIWPREVELAQGWFAIDEPSPGVFRIQEPLHDENVKSFLVLGTERAALIDTGMGVGDIGAVVASLTDLPVAVINSHCHWDHIGGNRHFNEIWIHEAEAEGIVDGVPNDILRRWFAPEHLRGPLPEGVTAESISYPPTPATGTLEGGEEIDLGERCLEVIHCPGHSPGGISLWDAANRILFTTDVAYPCTLYVYEWDDLAVYLRSFDRLLSLEQQPAAIYGSHCDVEMPVSMLAAQRDGIAAILAGQEPTRTLPNGKLRWEFDGFALQVG
jgi:glyoxylase-like metal-dependent hydrolase (beta-lactamase superfamily II)